MMDYNETLNFLFNRLQSFHNLGATAYKPGLETAYALSAAFGNPHIGLPTVHVGGTNGKGSTSHSIASVLQAAGLNVGLYTSPHLIDFRERIRVNGTPISEDEVTDFVDRYLALSLPDSVSPSFFELTTIMAFEHFRRNNVDIAVIEVGLGGRLDTTNIISPIISAITNISFDHTALLGNTLTAIAREKAGIIKPGVPAIIGRHNDETDSVFIEKAAAVDAPLIIAPDRPLYKSFTVTPEAIIYNATPWGDVRSELTGDCQPENAAVVFNVLHRLEQNGLIKLDHNTVDTGLYNICRTTGLMGRWMKLSETPRVIVDTAHNVDGWRLMSQRLASHLPLPLYMVIGFVGDKDIDGVLKLMPRDAHFFFVSPSVARGADADKVSVRANQLGLHGRAYDSVVDGYKAAVRAAEGQDDALVFIGGSTFVVADLLTAMQ